MKVNFKYLLVLLLFIAVHFVSSAQKNINNYKYILVPKSFDFTKGEDQYQLSSITKFLFNKYGYQAYFTDEDLPEDLRQNRCLALMADVRKAKGGFLKTKLEVALNDCFDNTVFTSNAGSSKLKQFDRAFSEALRETMLTFESLGYKYEPTVDMAQPAPPEPPKYEIIEDEVEVEEEIEAVPEITKEEEIIEVIEIVEKENSDSAMLYAQKTTNGFQVVDSKPAVVMILLNTGAENVFIVKDKSAIVYKEDGFWYYSQNSDDHVNTKKLNIKF